jgi:hypothetical protein
MSTAYRPGFRLLFIGVIILTAVITLVGCGGGGDGTTSTNTTPVTVTPTPVPTIAGTPTGESVTKTIGAAGGSVSSSGTGTATVTIPAGTLSADNVFGIQPITGEAPGALGNAFRLTPEGTNFSAPVKIIFRYTAEDIKGSTPDALGIAYQDSAGFWRVMKEVTRDYAAKTLTASTTHLSDWSILSGWQIRPPEASITPGKSIMLRVADCEPVEDNDTTTLVAQCLSDELLSPMLSGWAVNGFPGGNKGVGYVTGSGNTAVYQAPAGGAHETYAVSVELKTLSKDKVLLVSNITVVDPGTWTGTSTWSNSGANSILFQVKWVHYLSNDNLVYYRPEGTLSVDNSNSCLSYSNPTATIKPTDGELIIDLSKSPPSFSASAVTTWSSKISDLCGNNPDFQINMDLVWMPASGSTTAGGNEMTGTQTFEGGQTLTWSYTRRD